MSGAEPPERAGPPPERDPGLQPERTRLAWRRTTLSAVVAAVLAVRQALRHGLSPASVLSVALTALALLVFLGAAHRRMLSLGTPRPPALPGRAAGVVVGCTVALGVFGLLVVG
ncbi:DUF202 domain-containing protein [Streptomyces sp. NPDC002055]|uniref:DUF202 domain-containing protein n=1 Tax=Streptomyces sp. NPDC002055 TaxID=3154534 RepID=UPI00332B387D